MVYNDLKEEIYDPDDPRTFKSVCMKCHAPRPLTNLSKYYVAKTCMIIGRELLSYVIVHSLICLHVCPIKLTADF